MAVGRGQSRMFIVQRVSVLRINRQFLAFKGVISAVERSGFTS